MNAKKIVTVVLLVFVATSLGYMVVRENKSAPQAAPSPDAPQVEPNQQIVVYYFHGDVRCPTCHKLESYAKEALDTYFAKDIADGKIIWKPTNVDTAGNEHFVKDYELVTKSVILSRIVNGQQVAWKNLDRIWDLVSDKDKYLAYIRDSVSAFASPVRRSVSEEAEVKK
ncbi:MAG: nitrophenyl compound nitroreductase subunit ArsF family protein [Planctomycetota bacterium]